MAPVSSHPIHPIPSHLISSHPISSHPISSHLISSDSHLIPSHPVSSHLISSRPIPSHVISRTRARGSEPRLPARAQGAGPYPNQQAQLVASAGTGRQQAARNRRPPADPAGANGELRSVRVPVHMRCERRAPKFLKPPAGGLRLIRGSSRGGGAPNSGAISLGPSGFAADLVSPICLKRK